MDTRFVTNVSCSAEAWTAWSFPMCTYCRLFLTVLVLVVVGCNNQTAVVRSSTAQQTAFPHTAASPIAPAPDTSGGFDGARAYEHVRHLVELGPRPPGSDAIHAAQAYIIGQLKGYGCPLEQHDFHGSSPLGDLAMKNIVVKARGSSPGIVLFATHYDTVRIPDFVGADDGGSGTGTMLELARIVCARKNALNVWIAFFDGEEAQDNWANKESIEWTDTNSTYGSREMAASMALSGELKQVKAMILADMIGPMNLKIKQDANSTPWLNDLIWATAARLGYGNVFVNETIPGVSDDHMSFIRRGVAGSDIIDFSIQHTYWHTPQDTLDKIDPRSMAVIGHVFVELLPSLEKKFQSGNL